MVVINFDSGDGGNNYYTGKSSKIGLVWSGVMRKGVKRFKEGSKELKDAISYLEDLNFTPLRIQKA